MQVRNLKHNANGTIDMEIQHPRYGWIPFTATPDDPEKHGRDLYQEAIDGKLGEIADYVQPTSEEVLEKKRQSATLTRMQFMLALDSVEGLYDQAKILVDEATTPRRIKIMWEDASIFERMHPDLILMAQQLSLTDEQIDAVFGIA